MHRNLSLRSFLVAVVILFAGYAIAWAFAAAMLRNGIEEWAHARGDDGVLVTFREISVSGFPTDLEAMVEMPAYDAMAAAGWQWRGARMHVGWRPWRPDQVELRFVGRQRLAFRRAEEMAIVDVVAEAANAVVERKAYGAETIDLTLSAADLAAGDRVVRLAHADIALTRHRGADQGRSSLELRMTADGLRLPLTDDAPLGRELGRLAMDARLLGPWPPGRLAESVAAWRNAGGTLEIERIAFGWGPLSLNGNGTLALDGEMRPSGALVTEIGGFEAALDALVASGVYPARRAAMARIMLRVFARQSGGGEVIRVPLSAQYGQLRVGSLPLLRLPVIRWD